MPSTRKLQRHQNWRMREAGSVRRELWNSRQKEMQNTQGRRNSNGTPPKTAKTHLRPRIASARSLEVPHRGGYETGKFTPKVKSQITPHITQRRFVSGSRNKQHSATAQSTKRFSVPNSVHITHYKQQYSADADETGIPDSSYCTWHEHVHTKDKHKPHKNCSNEKTNSDLLRD